MKRRNVKLALITLSLFAVLMSVIPVYAENVGEISVSKAEGKPGEDVKISIDFTVNPGITVAKLNVEYDSRLTLTGVTDCGLLGSASHSGNYSLNPYILYWNNNTSRDNIVSTGKAAELTFKLPENASGGDYTVTVKIDKYSVLNSDAKEVPFQVKAGAVTVAGGKNDNTAPVNTDPEPGTPVTNPQPVQPVQPPVNLPPVTLPETGITAPSLPNPPAEVTEAPTLPQSPDEWINPFTDVSGSDEYYEAVKYVYQRRLFVGVSDTEFAPDMTLTRAMFVTVLGRMAEADVSGYTDVSFDDVVPGEWYAPYVDWAEKNGIVYGMGEGRFGVNELITIEQAAVIIARFAEFRGMPTGYTERLDRYMDVEEVDQWAYGGLSWAVENGVYSAGDGYLRPTAPASRADAAEMIYGFESIKA